MDVGLAPTPNYTVTGDRLGNTSFGPLHPDYRLCHVIEL